MKRNDRAKVIGMSGKMASGKDYTAELISEAMRNHDEGVRLLFTSFTAELRRELDSIAETVKRGASTDELSIKYNCPNEDIESVVSIFKSDPDFYLPTYSLFNRNEKSRELLQFWGTEVRRKQNDDYWVRKAREFVSRVSNRYDYIFFTDVRFENEAEGIKQMDGVIIRCEVSDDLRIVRLNKRGVSTTEESLNHSSETSLDNYEHFDYKVNTRESNDALSLAEELIALYSDYTED